MGKILFVLIVSLVVLLAGTLFIGLLVLLAYGMGWLLIRFLPFSPFEATLLSLIGLVVFGIVAFKLFGAFIAKPIPERYLSEYEEDEDDEDDDEYEDEEDEEPEEPVLIYRRGANQKRSFEVENIPKVAPDTRCPCGSGRKYKNCHGRTK